MQCYIELMSAEAEKEYEMRKKLANRICSVTLAAAMMLSSILTGCGGDAQSSSNNRETNAGSSEQAEEGEKPVLSVWAYWTNGDLYSDQGDWEYWQAIEEACNVDLQFLDSTGGKDALSLLAGTDDLPDIIIEYDTTFPGGVQKMLLDGSIIPLMI